MITNEEVILALYTLIEAAGTRELISKFIEVLNDGNGLIVTAAVLSLASDARGRPLPVPDSGTCSFNGVNG